VELIDDDLCEDDGRGDPSAEPAASEEKLRTVCNERPLGSARAGARVSYGENRSVS